ncbi:MAG: PDZ domain-containing protein [Chloroflexota bacterium]|nr:PDZ domain-containing protein [Chloroflexota bacterium]
MNNNDSLRWLLLAFTVMVALITTMMACLAGATGGYLLARNQFAHALIEMQETEPVFPRQQRFPDDMEVPRPAEPQELLNFQGALLVEVAPDSPAEQAGLQPGDLITAVDGRPVTAQQGLAELVGAYQPGDQISVTFVHHARIDQPVQTTTVALGANPGVPEMPYLGVRFEPFFLDFPRLPSDGGS